MGKNQSVTRTHEGEEVRRIVRRTGLTQEEFASKIGMTVQNLSYHMRKAILTDDFKRLLKDNGIVPFSKVENGTLIDTEKIEKETISNGSELINYNFLIKRNRIATVLLPKDAKKVDIDIIITHLENMKEAME